MARTFLPPFLSGNRYIPGHTVRLPVFGMPAREALHQRAAAAPREISPDLSGPATPTRDAIPGREPARVHGTGTHLLGDR
jgi:hypothetical protein